MAQSFWRTSSPEIVWKLALRLRSDHAYQALSPGGRLTPAVKEALVTNPTPPCASAPNTFGRMVCTPTPEPSPHTNEPSWTAWAFLPAAKLKSLETVLKPPPGITEKLLVIEFSLPPPIVE